MFWTRRPDRTRTATIKGNPDGTLAVMVEDADHLMVGYRNRLRNTAAAYRYLRRFPGCEVVETR